MVNKSENNQNKNPRVFRVFISSTFHDMHRERDELVKKICPQLRKLCEARGVTWSEVDLRWGINVELRAEEEVLPTCLSEIQKSETYFIGILGERYGWVPEVIPQDLINRYPRLAKWVGRSITEIEISCAMQKKPGMVFLYLRDPQYIDSIREDLKSSFLELPTPEEIEQFGSNEAERRACERRSKLKNLKKRILSDKFTVRKGYLDPEQLGQWVLDDLKALIERRFPEKSFPRPLDREAASQEAFARSRREIYIAQVGYYERLNQHVRGRDTPLVVVGEPGSGKSSLLANWQSQYKKQNPDDLLLSYFIGASPQSSDWRIMLQQVIGELNRHFGFSQEIDASPYKLCESFANSLYMAAEKKRIILIIDGLNQLEDQNQALDLIWLPNEIPGNVRLILSTLPGRPLEETDKRQWPRLEILPFNRDERLGFISEYLGHYSKELGKKQSNFIADASQSKNPFYLKVLLEELRFHGDYSTLEKKITYYLEAPTITELFERILERYEKDFEDKRPELVKEAMQLIWVAHRGLAESELMDLLGSNGEPLPRAYWLPLFLNAEKVLISHSGLIGFSHHFFRRAVYERYISTKQEERVIRLRLADYFETSENGLRRLDELPHQYILSQSWQRLYDLLASPTFFVFARIATISDLSFYWTTLEANSQFRAIDAYRPIIDKYCRSEKNKIPLYYLMDINSAAHILSDLGYNEEGLQMRDALVGYSEIADSPEFQASAFGNKAMSLQKMGKLPEALNCYKVQEKIYRDLKDKSGLLGALNNQGMVLCSLGKLDEAMEKHKEQEKLCIELDEERGLSACYGNQARVLSLNNKTDEAMKLYKKQEEICRLWEDKVGLLHSLGNQGRILAAKNRPSDALLLFKEQEKISSNLKNYDGLASALDGQARILKDRGDLEQAMSLNKKIEDICRNVNKMDGLAVSFGQQADIYYEWRKFQKAVDLYTKQIDLCRNFGLELILEVSLQHLFELQSSLGDQAKDRLNREDYQEASKLYKRQEQICKLLDDKRLLAHCLGNRALLLHDLSDFDGAMSLYKQQEQICRQIGYKKELVVSINGQGLILYGQGKFIEAMELFEKTEYTCAEIGDDIGMAKAMGNQALVFKAIGDLDSSMALLKTEEMIYSAQGDQEELQKNLGNQGNILLLQGKLDEAATLYYCKELICRRIDCKDGLVLSLYNQSLVLKEMGSLQDAISKAEEARLLAVKHRITNHLGRIDKILEIMDTGI